PLPRQDLASDCLDLFDGLGEIIGRCAAVRGCRDIATDVDRDDLGPLFGQSDCEFAPLSTGSTRDECDFAPNASHQPSVLPSRITLPCQSGVEGAPLRCWL